ncbi:MAG TPA: MFS transporter [Solirubrobacteraceae bacterium]|nr:MFS transporter [Solirubrobacteraceae bacterium]
MSALRVTPSVLRLRDFRLLLLGQGISVLGDRMITVALAFAVLEIGGGAGEVGLVLAAATVPMVASVLAGGVVADRLPRRRVMLVADVVRVATQGTMATLLLTGAAETWMLAALAGATGVATGFFNPASTGLLPQIVPSERLQEANGLRSTVVAAGEIGGLVVSGLIVAAVGAGWAIAVDAGTFVVSALCLVAIRPPKHVPREPTSFGADLREGFHAVRSRRWLWAVLAYFAVGNMLWSAWAALGPIVADRELGGADVWGLVLAGTGVGSLVGGLVATRLRPRRPVVLVALVEGLFVLPLAFLAIGAHVAVLLVGTFLGGLGLVFGMTVWESTMQRHIPAGQLSRVSSFDWFVSYTFTPIGLAIWGPVAALVGIHTALWIAFGLVLASIAALLSVPDIWRLPAAAGLPER